MCKLNPVTLSVDQWLASHVDISNKLNKYSFKFFTILNFTFSSSSPNTFGWHGPSIL